jgi:hypothetical protein
MADSNDKWISSLAERLRDRKLYKRIDVRAKIAHDKEDGAASSSEADEVCAGTLINSPLQLSTLRPCDSSLKTNWLQIGVGSIRPSTLKCLLILRYTLLVRDSRRRW